jgi:LmbE family N-acetylglucosaminyl deacetylase
VTYLFIVAHPDDEVLGAGATIYKLTGEGHTVVVAILSGDVAARRNRPKINELYKDMIECAKILGIKRLILGKFPNIEFNTVPHLKLVKFIEQIIAEVKPEVIFTHHPSDLNNDHYQTSIACQAAIRLFQRQPDILPVKDLFYMEILSSTEWGLNNAYRDYHPNTFVEVNEIGVEKKIEALSKYTGVMRVYPHPRSMEALKGLAAYRGCQAGMYYAESFESAFRREL